MTPKPIYSVGMIILTVLIIRARAVLAVAPGVTAGMEAHIVLKAANPTAMPRQNVVSMQAQLESYAH